MGIRASILAAAAAAIAGATAASEAEKADGRKPPRHAQLTGGRPPESYRGARRNAFFGRKPAGNTKPGEIPRRTGPSASPIPYRVRGRFNGRVTRWKEL